MSETELRSKFAIGGAGGGAYFERINVSHQGGCGAMLPRKIFKFKPSEMAGNALKTNYCESKL